ncbi:MAG: ferritin-like domain-containing protein [Acidobacteria bacterium]|nr:ferritin-like domain-containing protein [Acidobacteriota bacterium]
MPKIDSLQTMLMEELKDIYDAEQRLTKAIPKMIKAASDETLSEALQAHLEETQEQVTRLQEAFESLGAPAKAKPCPGMRGIIEEGSEHMSEDYSDDMLRDAAIIGSAQRVEHYEIAAYGTAIAHAKLLGLDSVVDLLERSLQEEKAADKKLTDIAERVVNPEAMEADDEEEERRPAARTHARNGAAASPRQRR